MLFSAELTKAALRGWLRWTLRKADIAQMMMAARRKTTTRPPIRISRMVAGSHEPASSDGARLAAASARTGNATTPNRQAKAAAGLNTLPPACDFVPVIEHPRIYLQSVWRHGFESSKRPALQQKNVA